jgi:hypothetical protein
MLFQTRSQLYLPTIPVPSDSATTLGDIESAVRNLRALWDTATGTDGDRERYLSHVLRFQQLYHGALLTVSGWLDGAAGRIIGGGSGGDADDVLRECGELQRDMEAVTAQINALEGLAKRLKADTTAENARLIATAIAQLSQRLNMLEQQVTHYGKTSLYQACGRASNQSNQEFQDFPFIALSGGSERTGTN